MNRPCKYIFALLFVFSACLSPLFAGGNREAPELIVETTGATYISPNGDGVQDAAEFELTVTLSAKAEYVPEYSIKIMTPDGEVIKERVEKEESGLNLFQTWFTGWKTYTISRSINWDGTDPDGNIVDEGEYRIVANVVDPDGKNTPLEVQDSFILDVTPPAATVTAPDDPWISPDGDGRKDALNIAISGGTEEVIWNGALYDANDVKVRTWTWSDAAPESVEWDGLDDEGRTVSNGEYSFRLVAERPDSAAGGNQAMDLAGNPSPLFRIDGILVHVETTPVSVSINEKLLSPNNDGRLDYGRAAIGTDVTDGISAWKLEVFNQAGELQRTLAGSTEPPRNVMFDGRDETGNVIADGNYRAVYTVEYVFGNRVSAGDSFTVDTRPPTVTVSASRHIFSPDFEGLSQTAADREFDKVHIKMKASEPLTWRGELRNASGRVVNTIDSTVTTNLVVLDGTDADGKALPDGEYTAWAQFTDLAGNRIEGSRQVTIDTRAPEVSVSLDRFAFSPDGDGRFDLLHAAVAADEEVQGYFFITDEAGTVYFNRPGNDGRNFTYPWNGVGENGVKLADGEYFARSEFRDEAGNWTRTEGLPFVIDTRAPADADVSLSDNLISPNGDGVRDGLLYNLHAPEPVTAVIELLDGRGKSLLSHTFDEAVDFEVNVADVILDAELPDGDYSVAAELTDIADNRAVIDPAKFTVDTVAPQGSITADLDLFSPDGDGHKDTLKLSVSVAEKVETELVIRDNKGREVLRKTLGKQPASTIWDGRISGGKPAPNGTYQLSAVFTDAAGNASESTPATAYLDGLGVEISMTFEYNGFSPNGDGVKDTNRINIESSDYQGLSAWTFTILDEDGSTVYTLEGKDTLPESLDWDGYASSGELNTDGYYFARLEAQYLKGNDVAVDSGTILLDANPPDVNLSVTSNPFAKVEEDAEEIEGEVFISLQVEDISGVEQWELDILNQEGEIVRSYGGVDDPSDQIAWNGTSETGARARVLDEYTLQLRVRDTEGNSTSFEQPIPLDILVVKKDGKFYLMVPNIIFGAYQHALDSYSPEQGEKNWNSIDRVVNIFERYPGYNLGLEAHALNVLDPETQKERWEKEEKVLVPLTERRAQSVESAFLSKGMPDEKVSYEYFGGTQPITDVKDKEVRWKNRRVEFIMMPE